MRSVKVAIVGAYSSGKTTLSRGIAVAYRGSRALEEHPRRVIAQVGNRAMRVPEVRDYLLVTTLVEEAEVAERPGLWVIDGGVINNIAHDLVLLENPPERAPLLELFQHKPYDAVFWCDIDGVPISSDGQRFTDERLRYRLHLAIGEVMRGMRVGYHKLKGDKPVRLAHAKAIIDSLMRA